MSLRNRLNKLEQKLKPVMMPLLMVPNADNHWTPNQLQEMEEAKVQGRMILRVEFVKPKKHVSD
jgi:hypothetical protein